MPRDWLDGESENPPAGTRPPLPAHEAVERVFGVTWYAIERLVRTVREPTEALRAQGILDTIGSRAHEAARKLPAKAA